MHAVGVVCRIRTPRVEARLQVWLVVGLVPDPASHPCCAGCVPLQARIKTPSPSPHWFNGLVAS